MAPRILTLFRSPVTGICGGWPTRLHVAYKVESWRKLASSLKIRARSWVWAFFLPRPRDSWVIWGSALGLIEEAVEFAAGRIEGALILVRAVVDQWSTVGSNH